MFLDAGPHVAFAEFVGSALVVGRAQTAEQAADQEQDLAVGRVVAVDDGLLDVPIPPLAEVADPCILEQYQAEQVERRHQGADLDPHGRAVHGRFFVVDLRVVGDGPRDGGIIPRHPLEDEVRRAVDEDEFRAWVLERECDRLELGRELGERADKIQR